MEGVAGFGIPAMLIAPLMLAAGFKPLTCIVLPLAANTTAVTFGALGTPFKIGLGITSVDTTVLFTVLLNTLPALALPFILAFLMGKTETIKLVWIKEWKMLLSAGFFFAAPYFITGLFSIEYPSVVAGSVGLAFFIAFAITGRGRQSFLFWCKLFWPYLFLVILLVTIKYITDMQFWQINENVRRLPLYQPGLVFILAALLVSLITNRSRIKLQIIQESRNTFSRIGSPLFTIFLLVCFAQLLKYDLNSFTENFSGINPELLVCFIPFIGVMGSFITGSATMSNLLLHQGVEASISIEHHLPLALLHTGSSIGNAISFQNIVMVKSVTDPTLGFEKIIGYNLYVVGVYLLMAIAVALIIHNYL